MNYKQKFGFYDSATGKAVIYDGANPQPHNVIKNGRVGFSIPKIFDGQCSKAVFDQMIADDSVRSYPSTS